MLPGRESTLRVFPRGELQPPEDPEDYVHRIGRTGRAGATGVSISFASEDDAFLLPDIEALLGHSLACMAPPAPGDKA